MLKDPKRRVSTESKEQVHNLTAAVQKNIKRRQKQYN